QRSACLLWPLDAGLHARQVRLRADERGLSEFLVRRLPERAPFDGPLVRDALATVAPEPHDHLEYAVQCRGDHALTLERYVVVPAACLGISGGVEPTRLFAEQNGARHVRLTDHGVNEEPE